MDEVQDVQPNIMFLLSLLAMNEVLFCGDTAQTIAKGVEFRFQELKGNFYHAKVMMQKKKLMISNDSTLLNAPSIKMLKVNLLYHLLNSNKKD